MLEHILAIIGAVVPLLSTIASVINHVVRASLEKGEEPSKALVATGAVLNVGAVNLDKATQLVKMLRAPSAPAAPPEK